MPNFDAGHYFLTVLVPVRLDSVLKNQHPDSRRHLIRQELAAMRTGERTAASQGMVPDNPFARTTRTHFARFVVLDDIVFNGRVPRNSLLEQLPGMDPLAAQPVDRLSRPFLIFVADFDAGSGAPAELHSYLTALWSTMREELTRIFQHCEGFDAVDTAEAFVRYVTRCQVETTMPFNDYWSAAPDLTDFKFRPYAAAAIATVVIALIGLFTLNGWLATAGLLASAVVAVATYRGIAAKARMPFPVSAPPAPASDLPTVLKALHVQRGFTELAIRTQGVSNQALYDAFGAFLAAESPGDLNAPTQPPGVIGVPTGGVAR
jgi:hypothetical protein